MMFARSSYRRLSNTHRKTSVSESLLNKVARLKACKIIKKGIQHWCFPVNIEKFLRTPTLKNICERLLLVYCFFFFFLHTFKKDKNLIIDFLLIPTDCGKIKRS